MKAQSMNKQKDIQVLIVEDDALVSEMIKWSLEEIGYTIVGEATNGQEAVKIISSLQPDVVIMDIEMPDMDGIEATRRIQARSPIPVVVLTAYETPDLVERASAAGAGAYLVKPSDAPEMERAITVAMARFNDMMELRRLNTELQAHNEERDKLIAELQEALAEIKTLRGLIPICSACKRIRTDQGDWTQIELYIQAHSEAEFSHGLCPDCAKKLYPDFYG